MRRKESIKARMRLEPRPLQQEIPVVVEKRQPGAEDNHDNDRRDAHHDQRAHHERVVSSARPLHGCANQRSAAGGSAGGPSDMAPGPCVSDPPRIDRTTSPTDSVATSSSWSIRRKY